MDELLLRRRMLMNTDHDFSTPGWDGRIWAYYTTSSADENKTLLYSTTNLGTTMEVDGTDVSIATSYTFAEVGEHLVKYYIRGDLTNQFRGCAFSRIYFPPITISGTLNYLFYGVGYLGTVRIPSYCVMPNINSSSAIRTTNLADIELTNITSWSNAVLHNNINRLVVKGTYSSIPNSAIVGFNNPNNYRYIWIESPNLTTIGTNFCKYFSQANAILVMNVNTPPTVSSTNFLQSAKSSLKIYVPYSSDHSILNAWKAADVWSTKANQIYELNPDGTIPV